MADLESIDLAESKGICFYACRMPGTAGFSIGFSATSLPGIHPGGFVVASFDSAPVTILPSLEASDIDSSYYNELTDSIPDSTPRRVHLDVVSRGKKALEQREAGKIVLSRVLTVCRDFKLSRLLESLDESYPHACVFAFHIPEYGTWAGASPEVLLNYGCHLLSTVSLAGTRRRGASGSWDGKNLEEQALVTKHIMDCFREEGFEPLAKGPFTHPAGPVEHLQTLISADAVTLTPRGAESLLKRLSPTPALGGYPVRWAAETIPAIEHHDRGCYGGYMGLVSPEGDMSLYVNLRSMKIGADKASLFVGGGITPLSVPADEWKETQIKAATLLSVLRKL